jgi:hypothetical protein
LAQIPKQFTRKGKMADLSSLDLAKAKEELIEAHRECSKRRLFNGAKW